MKKIYFKLLLSMMILLSLSFLPTFSESVSADTGGTVVAVRGNVVAYGKLEKVNTRKQLKKAVARRVINLDNRIRLLVNRKAMKYSFNEYKKMLYEITDNQKFNEIMEHTGISTVIITIKTTMYGNLDLGIPSIRLRLRRFLPR